MAAESSERDGRAPRILLLYYSFSGQSRKVLETAETYGLPPDPVVTTRDLPAMWRHAGIAALTLFGGITAISMFGRRR